ncbi:MAG: imidazoleglycerol-phosphate dehydratase, partial [Christensenellaceae bacterium]|nr:imidazoleglycerol-phosphate dehydratase [Christensenellaceae bacterium]
MDETLVMVSLDVSGRPFLSYDVEFLTERTGNFEACLLEEFLRGFAFAAGITLHVKKLYGTNTHHIIEAVMKALARALDAATRIDPRVEGIPSTKGAL